MKQIQSIEAILDYIAKIRSQKNGFITNFYLNTLKHGIWIKHSDLFVELIGDTAFFIKKNDKNFWHIFYCTTTLDELEYSLRLLKDLYPDQKMIIDVVGSYDTCDAINKLAEPIGYSNSCQLVRMSRLAPEYIGKVNNTLPIHFASDRETEEVHKLLHAYFSEEEEQIPYLDELLIYAHEKHIAVYSDHEKVVGFVIYEMNKLTLYLRYWFVHPNYRNKHVGSNLLNCFFYEGRNTRRQTLWVITTNENAMRKYLHYGFKEEPICCFVLNNGMKETLPHVNAF